MIKNKAKVIFKKYFKTLKKKIGKDYPNKLKNLLFVFS